MSVKPAVQHVGGIIFRRVTDRNKSKTFLRIVSHFYELPFCLTDDCVSGQKACGRNCISATDICTITGCADSSDPNCSGKKRLNGARWTEF